MLIVEEKPCAAGGGSVARQRRRWSDAQKWQIVAETHETGVSVAMVAQRYNLNANQNFRWRRLCPDEELLLALDGRSHGLIAIDL